MTKFTNVQSKELPDLWIARKTREQGQPVTTAQFKAHYRLENDTQAEEYLMRLVRDRRIRRLSIDGEIRWEVRS